MYDIATKSLAKSNGSIEPLDLSEIEKIWILPQSETITVGQINES